MTLAAARNARWSRLAGFGAYALSALLVGCVEDVSSLTGGHPSGGTAGADPSGGSAGAEVSGSGGDNPLGDAGQAGTAGEVNASGGQSGSAGSGGSSAGSAGSAPTCIPKGAETCNGTDDDCNGTIDDGCPASITWALQTDRPQLGDSTGGGSFADQCATDEVLTGIKAGFGSWLDQIRGVCSRLTVKPDTSKTPYTYGIELSGARDLAPHPETTPSNVTALSCPANRALVGVRISQQQFSDGTTTSIVIPRVWISCAELTLRGQGSIYSVGWQDPVESAPLSGASANDTAWFEKDLLPVPQIAVRLTGSCGDWLDRVGIATGKPSVVSH